MKRAAERRDVGGWDEWKCGERGGIVEEIGAQLGGGGQRREGIGGIEPGTMVHRANFDR